MRVGRIFVSDCGRPMPPYAYTVKAEVAMKVSERHASPLAFPLTYSLEPGVGRLPHEVLRKSEERNRMPKQDEIFVLPSLGIHTKSLVSTGWSRGQQKPIALICCSLGSLLLISVESYAQIELLPFKLTNLLVQ